MNRDCGQDERMWDVSVCAGVRTRVSKCVAVWAGLTEGNGLIARCCLGPSCHRFQSLLCTPNNSDPHRPNRIILIASYILNRRTPTSIPVVPMRPRCRKRNLERISIISFCNFINLAVLSSASNHLRKAHEMRRILYYTNKLRQRGSAHYCEGVCHPGE